jgi:hypothetical protein
MKQPERKHSSYSITEAAKTLGITRELSFRLGKRTFV